MAVISHSGFLSPSCFLPCFPGRFTPCAPLRGRGESGGTRMEDGERLIFLLIWAAFIFLFFSASHSKLIPYILPVFPPLAILMGKMFSDLLDREQQKMFWPESAVLGTVLVVMAILALIYPHVRDLAPVLSGPGLIPPGSSFFTKRPLLSPGGGVAVASLALSMAGVIWLSGRKKNVLVLFAGLCLCSYFLETLGLQLFMEGIECKKSSKELALLAQQVTSQGGCLASFGYEQSLPFYAGKRVVVVGDKGELEFGSRQGDQAAWFVEENDFMRLWQKEYPVVVLLKRADYERIAPRLSPSACVLGSKGKKVLICNGSTAKNPLPPGTQRVSERMLRGGE